MKLISIFISQAICDSSFMEVLQNTKCAMCEENNHNMEMILQCNHFICNDCGVSAVPFVSSKGYQKNKHGLPCNFCGERIISIQEHVNEGRAGSFQDEMSDGDLYESSGEQENALSNQKKSAADADPSDVVAPAGKRAEGNGLNVSANNFVPAQGMKPEFSAAAASISMSNLPASPSQQTDLANSPCAPASPALSDDHSESSQNNSRPPNLMVAPDDEILQSTLALAAGASKLPYEPKVKSLKKKQKRSRLEILQDKKANGSITPQEKKELNELLREQKRVERSKREAQQHRQAANQKKRKERERRAACHGGKT